MKTILLAAGEGTRLRPYTLEVPKCLVEVEGRSLIDRQLDILSSVGISNQIIIGGYKIDKLYGRGSKILENKIYDKTNMVWTLFCAEDELDGDVIVSYGDIVYSRPNLQLLLNSTADIAVTVDMDWENYWRERMEDPLSDAETLKLSDDGFITEIGQKPISLSEIEGQYMGLIKFSEDGVETLKSVFYQARKDGNIRGKKPENAYMTDLLQLIIDKGHKIKAVPVHGGWIEVDTVEDLESSVTKSRIRKIR